MTTQTIINGNSAEVLKEYPDNHFDCVVTDPPYGIEFLGKDWDNNTGAIEVWQECLRVLKPGGHLLAFSAARTYHRLATNLEDVGFEIRDQLMWIYSSGFPKAQDIGKFIEKQQGLRPPGSGRTQMNNDGSGWSTGANRCGECGKDTAFSHNGCVSNTCPYQSGPPANNEWAGWKTCLKPAHEPIVVCRKPFRGSATANVLEHGVGAFNIDGCRIPAEGKSKPALPVHRLRALSTNAVSETFKSFAQVESACEDANPDTRYPSNVIGEFPEDIQKYFYCPKVSRKERHVGLHAPAGITYQNKSESFFHGDGNNDIVERRTGGNIHPTVKPVALMAYLIKLVVRKGGIVLDPFNGSGSTGMAAKQEGMDYVGIDLDPSYCEVSRKRIEAWANNATLDEFL